MSEAPSKPALPKTFKGKRPDFFDDPAVDRVLAIALAIAGEVSVLRDRVDSIERVAAAKGSFTKADVEAYEPPQDVAQEREAWRQAYLNRIFHVIRQEIDDLKRAQEG
jgi:hypothetical protein